MTFFLLPHEKQESAVYLVPVQLLISATATFPSARGYRSALYRETLTEGCLTESRIEVMFVRDFKDSLDY